MRVRAGERIVYESRRLSPRSAELSASYGPIEHVFEPAAGSLEHFLTERYCLYTTDCAARPIRVDIHHPPWPLQPASAEIRRNTMALAAGLSLPDEPPVLHFARRQDVVAWRPIRLDDSA